MRYWKHLLLILALALLLRLAPVALHGMPQSHDAPFHIRMAGIVADSGQVPRIDASLGSRPNNYPPLYHVLVAELSLLTGISVQGVVMLLLPVLSSLVVLSVFVFVRRAAGEKNALIAALLAAVATPLIVGAYDSPENAVFFFLPLVLLLMHMGKERAGTLLYASSFLWNYFALVVTAVPFLLAYGQNKKVLKTLAIAFALMIGFSLLTKGTEFLTNESLAAGTQFIASNLRNVMPVLALLGALFFAPLAWLALRQGEKTKKSQWFIFLLAWCVISVLGLLSFFATPLFRGWEHLKFLALGGIMLIGAAGIGTRQNGGAGTKTAGAGTATTKTAAERTARYGRLFVFFLAVFMVLASFIFSFQILFPSVNKVDAHAMEFLEARAGHGERTIIAEPSMAEYMRLGTSLDPLLLTSLYFENTRKETVLGETLDFLAGAQTPAQERGFLQKSRAGFIITNFKDDVERGSAQRFAGADYLDKIYSLAYGERCPFPLPQGIAYDCGRMETNIYEINGAR
ncbi:MAG: STT3 domain-containing protein [Candidatus Diapherotrites archaeon]